MNQAEIVEPLPLPPSLYQSLSPSLTPSDLSLLATFSSGFHLLCLSDLQAPAELADRGSGFAA